MLLFSFFFPLYLINLIYNICIGLVCIYVYFYGSTKKLFIASFSNDLESQLNEEKINVKKIGASEDFQEGISSFFEKRKPNFKGIYREILFIKKYYFITSANIYKDV